MHCHVLRTSFSAARLCRSTARTTLAHRHNDRTQTKTPARQLFKKKKPTKTTTTINHCQSSQKNIDDSIISKTWQKQIQEVARDAETLSATMHRNAKTEEKTIERWSSPLQERDRHQRALNCLALQCCKTSHRYIRGHTIRSTLVFRNHLEMKFQESRCFVPLASRSVIQPTMPSVSARPLMHTSSATSSTGPSMYSTVSPFSSSRTTVAPASGVSRTEVGFKTL